MPALNKSGKEVLVRQSRPRKEREGNLRREVDNDGALFDEFT